MGAWGYGPLENDPAYDWTFKSIGPLVRKIDAALKKSVTKKRVDHEGAIIRTAAYTLERIGYKGLYPNLNAGGLASRFSTDSVLQRHLELAVEKLTALVGRDDYLQGFVDPNEARRQINAQIRALRRRLKNMDDPRNQTLLETVTKPSSTPRRRRLV